MFGRYIGLSRHHHVSDGDTPGSAVLCELMRKCLQEERTEELHPFLERHTFCDALFYHMHVKFQLLSMIKPVSGVNATGIREVNT